MTRTKIDRSTKDQSARTTGADSVEHQTGPDSTYAQLERLNVVIAERMDIMKKCADSLENPIRG